MIYADRYKAWIENDSIDLNTRNELISIQNNKDEIKERFYKNLEFGTGGLRGLMGAGTNRVNIYTIRKVTQGLANFLKSKNKLASVAIAYDSRNFSDIFAEQVAVVLAANNIKVFIFDALRPTPELSFAVRQLSCDAGIVITASHNPSIYNGYKVYGEDGGQITLEIANEIITEIERVDIFRDIKICKKEDAIAQKLIEYIGEKLDKEYLERVKKLAVNPDISQKNKNFKIVYTPLHGAGLVPVCSILKNLGYNDIHIVESQKKPNGNFPTVKSPNPEDREALLEAIQKAEQIEADIVLGTDPDADRVGIAVRDKEGMYELLTGNQIGALLTHYIVSNKTNISNRDVVIKTIVTSELGAKIAEAHGATVFDTLTGFKFIGEKIKEFEETGEYDFLFGYEESYGYLAGNFVRDKDAIIASMLIVEMSAYYKLKGKSLSEVMDLIYKEYGYYVDSLESFVLPNLEGQEKIQKIMQKFRAEEKLTTTIGDIERIEDYQKRQKTYMHTLIMEELELPLSNVIKIYLNDGSWFAVRPSGTEPKFKVYYSTIGNSLESAELKMKELKVKINNYISND